MNKNECSFCGNNEGHSRWETGVIWQCRTALAAMLCAGEPDCPTEREAKRLCVAAMQELNKELNTKTTK